jgi:putative hydrolase of the HAD superfamily
MNKINHLFFDLDRTLWDFETNSKIALKKIYDKYRLESHFEHFLQFQKSYQNINNELWKKYGKGKISKDELRIIRFEKTLERVNVFDKNFAITLSQDYISIAPKEKNLFPSTLETIKELAKNYQLHIITNGFAEAQFVKLESSGLRPFFDVIVCSEMVGKTKPHREIFEHALLLANAKVSESIMIGDDHNTDIMGAIQVGMQAILFDPSNRYRKSAGLHKISNLNELPLLITMIK